MKLRALAAASAVALAIPLVGLAPAQAAMPRDGEVPGKPVITATFAGSAAGSIVVDWQAPGTAGGNPDTSVSSYQVRYSENLPTPDWTELAQTKSPVTEATIKNLKTDKSYIFEVRAYNTNGAGDYSAPSQATDPAQGVGAPTFVVATPGEGLVDVSWTEPDPGAASYQVQYRTDAVGSPWLPAAPLSTNKAFYRVTDLTPGTGYYFRVRSVNSETDISDWTTTTAAVTPVATPSAPSNVRAVAGDASAVVSWSAPSPTPDRYEVQYRTSASGSTWGPGTALSTTATSLNVGSLTNGTGYFFRVRAIRGSNASSWVETTSAVTPVASTVTPAAPTSVTGIPQDSAVTLTWAMPAGQQVTNYEIQFSTNNSQWVPTPAINTYRTDLHYTVTGLNNGTTYYFRVRSMNGAVGSAWTQLAGSVVPVALPGPPLNLVGTAGNSQVTLTWTAPTIVGQTSQVVGYTVQYSSNGGGTWVTAPVVYNNVTTTTVTGLTNGLGYIFRVRAVSYAGEGAWSNSTGTITPPGGPSVPTNVVAVAGNSQATVTWNPAVSTGSPVFAYRVTATPGGNFCTTNATPPATPLTSCTVTGLTNGTAYYFTVVALTQSGNSATSNPSNPVTPQGPSQSLRITDSGRDGANAYISGTSSGLSAGTTLNVMVKQKAGGKFASVGQIQVAADGTFDWSSRNTKKLWVKVTGGGMTSNTVVIAAR